MTAERESPLGLDLDPDEAFARFLGVDPAELPRDARLKQKKRPPKRPPGVNGKGEAPTD